LLQIVISIGLYVWDITEEATTVIASAIPALRVLVVSDTRRLYGTPKVREITTSGGTPQFKSSKKSSSSSSRKASDPEELQMEFASERSLDHAAV